MVSSPQPRLRRKRIGNSTRGLQGLSTKISQKSFRMRITPRLMNAIASICRVYVSRALSARNVNITMKAENSEHSVKNGKIMLAISSPAWIIKKRLFGKPLGNASSVSRASSSEPCGTALFCGASPCSVALFSRRRQGERTLCRKLRPARRCGLAIPSIREPVWRNDSPPHLLIFPCWFRDESVIVYAPCAPGL
jgi:hypothetical protein